MKWEDPGPSKGQSGQSRNLPRRIALFACVLCVLQNAEYENQGTLLDSADTLAGLDHGCSSIQKCDFPSTTAFVTFVIFELSDSVLP